MAYFDPTYLFLSLIFGLIGIAAWRHGRREASIRHMVLAIALMVFPYFLTEVWKMLAAGGALTILLFWP